METRWLVSIDDTDNLESIGTGKLARWLGGHLESQGWTELATVTRHQLLVHPDIPYTSHNSSACIEAWGRPDAGDGILAEVISFLEKHEHEGANPGLCVVDASKAPGPLIGLARRAQEFVLDLEAFDREVAPYGLRIWSKGETGQGRIGAVCGVVLRSTGEDGRFIDLPGIRSVSGRVAVGTILERTGVDRVESTDGRELPAETEIETRHWVRPELRGGRAVLLVHQEGREWVPAARRSMDDG